MDDDMSDTCVCQLQEVHPASGLRAAWLLPILLLGLWAFSLSHSLFDPLGHDQGMYQYMTERVIAGDRLYVDVWDQNGPGIIGVHWLATHLAGRTSLALRVFDAAWQMATLAALVLLAGRDGRRWSAGWLAAILYVFAYYGMGYVHTAQREGFAVLPLLLAVHALADASPGNSVAREAARHAFAGLMLFLVLTIKPPLGLIFGALWVFSLLPSRHERGERVRLAGAAGLALGFAAGAALAVFLFLRWGWWSGFWPTFIRANVPGYTTGPQQLREIAGPVLLGALVIGALLWLAARPQTDAGVAPRRERSQQPGWGQDQVRQWLTAVTSATTVFALLLTLVRWPEWQAIFLRISGLLIIAWAAALMQPWKDRSRIWRMMLLVMVASLAAIILQGRFYFYQFPPLLVCAAYLAGDELTAHLGLHASSDADSRWKSWSFVCVGCVAYLAIGHWGAAMSFPELRPFPLGNRTLMQHYAAITKHKPTFPRFDVSAAMAARVRSETAEHDKIACLVDEPRLYWLSQRPTACPLLRPGEVYRHLYPEFLRNIELGQPRVILARIPAGFTREGNREKLTTAIIDWAVVAFGPEAKRALAGYHVSDVMEDLCMLQAR